MQTRREFIVTAGSGLVLGFFLPSRLLDAAEKAAGPFVPNAFLRIAPDDSITVIAKHDEMGQGIHTSLAIVLAEELDADFSKVRVESAPADDAYKHSAFGLQMTGGSTSSWSSFQQMREAGATARAMLIAAAAKRWKVDAASCIADNGAVIHRATNRRFRFGELVDAAAKLPVPANVKLKDTKDFKLIGKPQHRVDSRAKVTGKAQFSVDTRLPGMLTAVVARSPYFGGTLKKFGATKAKTMPSVRAVIQVPSGVAVVADSFWEAKQARDALQIEWNAGPSAGVSSDAIRAQFVELAKKPGLPAVKKGDVDKALESAAKKVSAVYEAPYLAHAMMEPLSCTVTLKKNSCEIVTGSQFLGSDRAAAAKALGLEPEKVTIRNTYLGGGFGRRANSHNDFVVEAVEVCKAARDLNAPIKTVWTREDDISGGYYRPFSYHALEAALDGKGNLIAWQHRIICQSILEGTPFAAMMIKDGIDGTSVEGAADLPYAVPNLSVELQTPKLPVPVLWWRSVGHTFTAFATECFIDEVAAATGKDPVDLRRALLKDHPRHRRVLELAADKAGWGTPLPNGVARGIAVHESFRSYVAQVAEVSLNPDDGTPVVRRVVCAIDCGPTINPDQIKAQMEGATAFGLTATLMGQITLKDGKVQQSNFDTYPLLRIDQMPKVDVHIVESTDQMGGVGEPGVPCVAPAVCNALFALTGKRIRTLPVQNQLSAT
jgi:isoquinoline 1-oxidoreductase beta subunit